MKQFFLTFTCVAGMIALCNAQQLPRSYYSKYYTPINNSKADVTLSVGLIFPRGTIKEQPDQNKYLEDPFKGNTGLGLKTGYTAQFNIRFSGGDDNKVRTNPRIMGLYSVNFASHKVKWEVDSDEIKTTGMTYLGMGGGLEMSYSLKNICVLSAYYKLMGSYLFKMPGFETTNGGYTYTVSPSGDSKDGYGYFGAYGFGVRYRKRLSLNLEIKNQKLNREYTLIKESETYNYLYNPDRTSIRFPGFFEYKTIALSIGFIILKS